MKRITKKEALAMPPEQVSDRVLAGMHPFTITFKTPREAMFIFQSTMYYMFRENSIAAGEALSFSMRTLGRKQGIQSWMNVTRGKGYPVPDWFGPLCQHIKDSADPNIIEE